MASEFKDQRTAKNSMEGSGVDITSVTNETNGSEGTPLKDWLHHTNHSLSRLKDVKQSNYRLGGGPREREKNCLCNHRSKSKESYLNTAAIPPELTAANQETASLPDMSVPELLKQFHERQKDTKIKRKQRPHTATSSLSRDGTRNNEKDQKASLNRGAFIAVKGCTVAPKPRPASGSLAGAASIADDSSYKGMVHLDPQHVEKTRRTTIESFRKYSVTFGGDEDEEPASLPSGPRASPELNSPAWGSMEELEKDECPEDEYFSEDETSLDGSVGTVSAASHPLVFEIPTADVDYVSDDDESVSCTPGRLSTDYVAKSRVFLNDLTEKNKIEAEELNDMFTNMEQMKTRISQLQISPRDLEELEEEQTKDENANLSKASSLCVVNVQFDSDIVESEPLTEGSTIETFWVEERVPPVMSYALPTRNNRVRSAPGRDHAPVAKIKRQLSDDAMLLRGQTVSFLNSEDLAVRGRIRASLPRRSTEPAGSLRVLRSGDLETRSKKGESSLPEDKKVTGRPPRPKTAKKKRSASKAGLSRTREDSLREVASDDCSLGVNRGHFENPNPGKSSLKKSSSESNIPETVETFIPAKGNFSSKKSVSFSQEVLSQDRPCSLAHQKGEEKLSASCQKSQATPSTSFRDKPGICPCDEGIVIRNGFEVKPEDAEGLKSEGESATNESKLRGITRQSDRAKLVAQVKAATRCSCAPEECPCRNITRPTMGVIEDAKAAKSVPSPGLRLLKQRPSRPSSAPIRRAEDGGVTSGVQRKPRVQSASVAHKRTTSEGSRSRPRPFSAHIQRPSNKESRRNHAAVKALKEGYLFKEKPVSTKDPKCRRKKKGEPNDEAFEDVGFVWGQGEGDVAPSEECEEVYSHLKEKGLNVSMDTIKRGLMAPARRASEQCMTSLCPSSSSGLLSRPEKWLPAEYARIKVWDDVLKHAE